MVKVIVDRYAAEFSAKMEEVVGETEVELDGRFKEIRTSETNLGNFVTDIMRASVQADVVILNSGTLRSDEVHAVGHDAPVGEQACLAEDLRVALCEEAHEFVQLLAHRMVTLNVMG